MDLVPKGKNSCKLRLQGSASFLKIPYVADKLEKVEKGVYGLSPDGAEAVQSAGRVLGAD